jgi:hypothetical protein
LSKTHAVALADYACRGCLPCLCLPHVCLFATDHCFADLISAIATSMASSSEMADCTRFESTAQVLIQMSRNKRAAAALLPCTEAILGDSVLRRLLKEDADVGCGVLIAVLLALDGSGIVVAKQVQESVHKVRAACGRNAGLA